MRTEVRFIGEGEKAFWIEVYGDQIGIVIDEDGVPITAFLDVELAKKFRLELGRAIAQLQNKRAG
jgi:hypothetical protein